MGKRQLSILSILGQICHGCINHDIVFGPCSELLMRLSYYPSNIQTNFDPFRVSNPGPFGSESDALSIRPPSLYAKHARYKKSTLNNYRIYRMYCIYRIYRTFIAVQLIAINVIYQIKKFIAFINLSFIAFIAFIKFCKNLSKI